MVTATSLDRTFAALGDPARRSIVHTLSLGPATVKELSAPFAMSRPAVSKHLRVLKDAGIVTSDARGRQNWYSLREGGLADADAWLDEVQSMWATALGSLKQFVEEANDVHGE
ncbi:MAG: metalloregulator ArsR/SmtB family transcription factor [Acidimicrobiia bacterium]|nr:metalloregulator ArsR/SmtB family transcription factor [Acidimicrobiia bacterium]